MSIKKQRRCGLCNLWPEACACGQPCACKDKGHGTCYSVVACKCDLTCPDPACKAATERPTTIERDCIKCGAAFVSKEASQCYCKRCALHHGEGKGDDDITDADKKTVKKNFDKLIAERAAKGLAREQFNDFPKPKR